MKIYDILSKLLQVRKYVFLNIIVVLSYTCWIFFYISNKMTDTYRDSLPLGAEPDWFGPGFLQLVIAFLSAMLILGSYCLTFIEVIVRYLLRNKSFEIKFSTKFKIPKILNILYSIIFYVGLCLSILPTIAAVAILFQEVFRFSFYS